MQKSPILSQPLGSHLITRVIDHPALVHKVCFPHPLPVPALQQGPHGPGGGGPVLAAAQNLNKDVVSKNIGAIEENTFEKRDW